MKKFSLAVLCLVSVAISCAQNSKPVFESDKLIWYGIDFTQAKFYGVKEASEKELVETFIPNWSRATVYETDKFPLRSIFQKLDVYFEPSVVDSRNKSIDPTAIKSGGEVLLTPSAIEKIISTYKPSSRRPPGLGAVLIIESFDKKKETAAGWIAFFDIASSKLYFTKRVTGEAGGGGLHGYWLGGLIRLMNKVQQTEFDTWRKEYNK